LSYSLVCLCLMYHALTWEVLPDQNEYKCRPLISINV
jgi:hypothetical protein